MLRIKIRPGSRFVQSAKCTFSFIGKSLSDSRFKMKVSQLSGDPLLTSFYMTRPLGYIQVHPAMKKTWVFLTFLVSLCYQLRNQMRIWLNENIQTLQSLRSNLINHYPPFHIVHMNNWTLHISNMSKTWNEVRYSSTLLLWYCKRGPLHGQY